MLGTDHPQQTAHPAVVEADRVAGSHRLGAPGDYIQPRGLTVGVD